MKIKKIVSVIAALAMSASAFAGLTVHAAYQDGYVEVDYIGTSTKKETFDDYAANTNSHWAPQAGASWVTSFGNGSQWGITNVTKIDKPDDLDTAVDTAESRPTYIDGKALAARIRSNGNFASLTYTADTPVSKGNVYLNTDVSFIRSGSVGFNFGIYLRDNSGNNVVGVKWDTPGNNNAKVMNIVGSETKNTTLTKARGEVGNHAMNVSFDVDLDAHKATVILDTVNSTNDKCTTETFEVAIAADANIAQMYTENKCGASSTNNDVAIDNTQFYAVTESAENEYTVKYMTDVDDDNSVVKTYSGKAAAGAAPIFSKDTFDVTTGEGEDAVTKRYFYVSDNSENVTVAAGGGTVVKVLVREAEFNTGTVKAVISGTDTEIGTYSNSAYEGTEITVYYPKYILHDGAYYVTPAASTDGAALWYGKKFTTTATETVNYTKADDVVYAKESNDMGKSTNFASTSGNAQNRFSSGNLARLTKDAYIYTDVLSATKNGVYNVTIFGRNQSGSGTANLDLYLKSGDTLTKLDKTFEEWDKSAQGEKTVTNIEIPAGNALVLRNNSADWNSNLEIDYVCVTDVTPVTGFATKAEYKRTAENTASLRFLASPTFKDATVKATNYGFRLVHITDGNIEIKTSTVDSTEELASGGTFHTTLEDIDITGATSFGFYAMPWVQLKGSTVNGDPFTYTGQLDTDIDVVQPAE